MTITDKMYTITIIGITSPFVFDFDIIVNQRII